MNRMQIAWIAALSLPNLALCAPQEEAVDARQDPLAEMQKLFADHGLKLDPKAGTITIAAEVGRPDQPLEFLLIHRRGKAHEALLITQAKASVLNAAFLALGYRDGQNARVVDRDPLPTPEQVADGAPLFDVFPPEGMPVWFTARWQRIDDDGNELDVEVPVEDLILDLVTERPVEDVEWIYLGGNMAPLYRDEPPVFVADFEGNDVSVVYKSPPNHLVTMKHERATDDQVWWVTERVPPPGTPVELVVHKARTRLHAEREERIAARRKIEAAAQAGDDGGKKKDG